VTVTDQEGLCNTLLRYVLWQFDVPAVTHSDLNCPSYPEVELASQCSVCFLYLHCTFIFNMSEDGRW